LRKSKAAEHCRSPNVAVLAAALRRFSNGLEGHNAHYLGLQKIPGNGILIIPLRRI
jgi:hypothetical protein